MVGWEDTEADPGEIVGRKKKEVLGDFGRKDSSQPGRGSATGFHTGNKSDLVVVGGVPRHQEADVCGEQYA